MPDCGFLDKLRFLNVCIHTKQEEFLNDSKIKTFNYLILNEEYL